MAGGEVAAVLLKEAQQEIALLRTDLFNTRRLAEERRQAVEALQSERERLTRHCDEVEAALRTANAQLNHVPELQHRCMHLELGLKKLQSELETSVAARRILEQELADERRQRGALVDQKSLLESDRARLAKQRDDLAAQLRVEQKKAREAEEEQVRAEEDAAALRAEVSALQQAAAAAAAPAGPPTPSGLGAASGASTPAPGGPSGAAPSAAETAAAIAASVAAATTPLLEQLEHERNRATALLSSLHAAKSEIMELTQRLGDYEARHADMVARGHRDPEHHAHLVAELRAQNAALVQQLAEQEQRARRLEEETAELRSAVAAAAAAPSAAASDPPATHPGAQPPPSRPQANGTVQEPAEAPSASGASAHHHQQHHTAQHPSQNQQQHHRKQPSLTEAGASTSSHPLSLAHRMASSGSLYGGGGGAGGSETGDGGGGEPASWQQMADDVARLRQQVSRLKASRDKLLAEIDKQWGEIERLGAENAAMTDELRAQRALAANWERQAQDGIAQVEQLKDLLEDAARWGPAAAVPPQPAEPAAGVVAAADAAAAGGGGGPAGGGGGLVESLQTALLAEKARVTELELQLRGLAAELLRCQHSSLDLGRSFLPMMAGVEKRLAELCRKGRAT